MAKTYGVVNGAAPGANPAATVATGTATKTMLQLATAATTPAIRIVEWWAEFDAFTAAAPGKVELLRHGGGPVITGNAYVAADITKENDPNAPASSIQLGAALSCWGPSAEVTPTTPFQIETHLVPPTSGYYTQFPYGKEPEIQVAAFARIRTLFGTTVNCLSGVMWEE